MIDSDMVDMETYSSVEGDGPLAPHQLGFEETDLVRGAVLSPSQGKWHLTRLGASSLVDLTAVRLALATARRDDVLAVIEIKDDCAILVRQREGREWLCVFEPGERYYFTLAWDVVTALGAKPSTPDILLPTGDPTLLVDWGVSREDVERFLAGEQGAEGFVTEIVDAFGVGREFNALFPLD